MAPPRARPDRAVVPAPWLDHDASRPGRGIPAS